MKFGLLLPMALFLLPLTGWGQAKVKSDSTTQAQLEKLVSKIKVSQPIFKEELIETIIIDQSKTRAGKDFYDLFVQGLDIPTNIANFNILIDEKPGMGAATIISVYINDIETYSNYLQPKRNLIEETASEAIEYASDFIANYNQIILELTNKEQKGSGFF